MKDFFEDLYDEDNSTEGDPSFSIQDFRKWLSKQKKDHKSITEERIVKEKEEEKEEFKEKFKERLRKKKKKD